MAFGLKTEKQFEEWLRPFAAPVRFPGYKRGMFKSTKLFFELYWQLLAMGYSEQQIADHAVGFWRISPLPPELALEYAVFHLANHQELECPERFIDA